MALLFPSLLKNSPRHRDARDRALAAARVVVEKENPLLRQYLVNHKALPLKALEKSVARKRPQDLERYRQYIIAIAVMLMGNYEYLTGYIGQKRRVKVIGSDYGVVVERQGRRVTGLTPQGEWRTIVLPRRANCRR